MNVNERRESQSFIFPNLRITEASFTKFNLRPILCNEETSKDDNRSQLG